MKPTILNLCITDYLACYSLQKKILNEIKHDNVPDRIIITEHYPVITIGRRGSRKNLLVSEDFLKSRGIEVIETDRGGDITYHGPGQMVIYPIIDLKRRFKNLHLYMRCLEDLVIALLKKYGIKGYRVDGRTGVWTDNGKIASIGIAVSQWVAYHGIALNIDCDLTPFSWINPCGFKDIKVTSIAKNWCPNFSKDNIKQKLVDIFYNNEDVKTICVN